MLKSSKKVFLLIFAFFMVLLVIPITLFFVNYLINQKQTEIERYLHDQKQTADTISTLINHQFTSLTTSTAAILSDERILEDINQFDESDPNGINQRVDLFKRRKSIKTVASYIGGASIIDDILVISRNKNVVVTGSGWFYKDAYIDAYYTEHNIDLNFATQNNLYPINILSFCQDKDCKNSACLVSAPIICSVYGNSGIDVVFLVNKRRIQSLITDLSNSSYQGQMILLNQNPIFEHGTMTSTEKYNYTTLATNTNMSYSFSFLEPHIPFWSDNIFMSFIFIFIGCSIVGIVLSMLFSNPLYRMYLRLYQTQNKEDQMIVRRHIFANPAAVFESYVERIVTSHERLTTKVGQYRSIIDNNNLLLSILLTEDAENYLDEIIEICPWFSEEGIYSILLINETDSKKSETTVGKFLSEIFDNYQLCGSLNYHFMNILSCDFALLLSHSTQNADIVLNKLCTEIETTVSNVIIAPGSTAQGIIGIQTSYHQARKILQQRIFNTTEVIEGYFFPVNLEFQLMNSLKSADCEKSKNILSTAFQQNDNLNLSTVQMKKFYQVIFESFERFAKENEYDIKPTKKQFIHSLDTNFKDIREIFFSLCSELSDFTVKKLDEGVQQLGIEIYNYIKNNFADVNICTDSIANHFHISRSALYKIMRSISEVSLTDLINKLRINKATTLLEESSDTITNISKQVGYDSYCTFKRVFIKNTGISPSEYKLEGRLQVHRKSASQHSGAGGF